MVSLIFLSRPIRSTTAAESCRSRTNPGVRRGFVLPKSILIQQFHFVPVPVPVPRTRLLRTETREENPTPVSIGKGPYDPNASGTGTGTGAGTKVQPISLNERPRSRGGWSLDLDAGAGMKGFQVLTHHALKDVKGLFAGAMAGVDRPFHLLDDLPADIPHLRAARRHGVVEG